MLELTSLHEAAHAVLSYLSSYHFLTADIKLTSNSTGVTYVTLSRKKILAEGKEYTANIVFDPDVIEDAAIIFYAGLEAEKIYCEEISIEVDESHSLNDYNYVDELIENSSKDFEVDKDSLIAFSRIAVLANWEPIKIISNLLMQSENNTIDAVTVIEMLDQGFGINSFK